VGRFPARPCPRCRAARPKTSLSRSGRSSESGSRFPGRGRTVDIARPGNIDHLLDLAAGDPEQNLPYWAEVWPSGIALADVIARDAPAWRGVRVLEVGCGSERRRSPRSAPGRADRHRLCPGGARAMPGERPAQRRPRAGRGAAQLRNPDPRTMAALGRSVPVVLAADILYEQRDMDPLLAFADQWCRPAD
jgi:hypothetical protein